MAQSQVGKWHSGLLPGLQHDALSQIYFRDAAMQHNWCRRLQHWITPAATRKLCLRSVLEPQLPEGLTTGVRRVWNVSSFSWMCWWLAEQDFFEEIKPYFLKLLQSARPWGQIGKGGWTIEVWDFETAVLRVWPFGCSPPLRCYPARRKLARKKLSVLSICSLCTRFHWPLSPQDNVEACRCWIFCLRAGVRAVGHWCRELWWITWEAKQL